MIAVGHEITRVHRPAMVRIKTDLFRRRFVDNRSLTQIDGRTEFTDRETGVRVLRSRRIRRRRQVEGVVVWVFHSSRTAGQDHQSCQTEDNPRYGSFHNYHPPGPVSERGSMPLFSFDSHYFGTFRSSGCLIRIRLHGRCFTDSVKSSRFSVAVRRFSIVSSIL